MAIPILRGGQLKVLDERGIARIHQAVLRTLSEVGVRMEHRSALEAIGEEGRAV